MQGEGLITFAVGGGVVVTKNAATQRFADSLRQDDDVLLSTPLGNNIAHWGSNNFFPQEIISAVINNSIAPGLLNFKANTVVGKGICMYKEEVLDGKRKKTPLIDLEVGEWLEKIDIEKYLIAASQDAVFFANVFSEIIFSRDAKQVVSIKRLDASNCRVDSLQKNAHIYQNWDKIGGGSPAKWVYPLVKESSPVRPVMCYHAKNYFPGASHYGVAPWVGSLNWIKMGNEIPIFKHSAIKNGFSIRYHIEMPANYFEVLYPNSVKNPATNQPFTDSDRLEKERSLRQNMNDFLSGGENSGKAFISKYALTHDGKAVPGWKITPLDDKNKYDAYLNDFNTSNQAIMSAHNVDPSIASISTAGSLSSGSDKRNAFNILTQISLNNEKKLVLEAINFGKNYTFPNKKNIKIDFENIELTTTDVVKSGVIQNIA